MSELKTSKAQRDAIEKYETTLDRYLLRMPKGTKQRLEDLAIKNGYTRNGKPSVNQLINKLIADYLETQNWQSVAELL